MLELLAVVLLAAWLLGVVVVPVGTPLIHVLLVIVLVLMIVRAIQGRNIL